MKLDFALEGGVVALLASRGGIGFQFKQIVVAARFSFLLPANSDRDGRDGRGDHFAYKRMHARKCNESVKLDRASRSGNGVCYCNLVSGPLLAENGDAPLFEQH